MVLIQGGCHRHKMPDAFYYWRWRAGLSLALADAICYRGPDTGWRRPRSSSFRGGLGVACYSPTRRVVGCAEVFSRISSVSFLTIDINHPNGFFWSSHADRPGRLGPLTLQIPAQLDMGYKVLTRRHVPS
jgi:hypothetical protein